MNNAQTYYTEVGKAIYESLQKNPRGRIGVTATIDTASQEMIGVCFGLIDKEWDEESKKLTLKVG